MILLHHTDDLELNLIGGRFGACTVVIRCEYHGDARLERVEKRVGNIFGINISVLIPDVTVHIVSPVRHQRIGKVIGKILAHDHLVAVFGIPPVHQLKAHVLKGARVNADKIDIVGCVAAVDARFEAYIISVETCLGHDGLDARDLVEALDRLVVKLALRLRAGALVVAAVDLDDGEVAHIFEHLVVGLLHARADGNHHDDGRTADEHAQHRQDRASFAP